MTTEEIIEYIIHTPENTNPNVLRDMLGSFDNSVKEQVINYVLSTPHNSNPNILRDMLIVPDLIIDPPASSYN